MLRRAKQAEVVEHQRAEELTRAFEIIIETPEGLIFDGTASFTLNRQFLSCETAKIGDHPEATVVRADRNCD
jgi:hypothetical protein